MTTTSTAKHPTRPAVSQIVARTDASDLPSPASYGDAQPKRHTWRNRLLAIGGIFATVVLLMACMAGLRSGLGAADDSLVYFTVRKTDLPVTISERGTLESQNEVKIICEVEDVRGDGIYGTPILWVVDNGSSVEKGDLLVELDASSHKERLDQQVLETEEARARQIKNDVYYQNRITRNQTALAKAELALAMSQLALKQYEDEQGGTYQIERQDIELSIEQRAARQTIDQTNLTGTKALFDIGYKSKGDLAEAELKAVTAKAALSRQQHKLQGLIKYDYQKMKLRLQGDLDSAKQALVQTKHDNEALLAQAKARRDSADMSLAREEERLERYKYQLEKCKIYAPQSGMVAYAVENHRRGASSTITEGVAVRERQALLSLPNLSRMQVKTAVHESVVDTVKSSMSVTVKLDAFPERRYAGTVKSVAVLPNQGGWLSSGTKVYKTVVTIDEEVQRLKPGMTAVVDIHVDHLQHVLCVPVQALVQRRDDTWCYVAADGEILRQAVSLGKTNDKFVEILTGLSEGDQVVLNPSDILQADPSLPSDIAPDADRTEGVSLD